LTLFFKSRNSDGWLVVFAIYSAAFSLAAFQALMIASFVFHQMVLAAVVYGAVGVLGRAGRRAAY